MNVQLVQALGDCQHCVDKDHYITFTIAERVKDVDSVAQKLSHNVNNYRLRVLCVHENVCERVHVI